MDGAEPSVSLRRTIEGFALDQRQPPARYTALQMCFACDSRPLGGKGLKGAAPLAEVTDMCI